MKAGAYTKEYVLSIPKTINENGCWIPNLVPLKTGYVPIRIKQINYYLHRVALCLWHNIDYYDKKIETRHSIGCSKACFNPEHLKPGTAMQNIADAVLYKEHANAAKDCCPKCDGPYTKTTLRRGPQRGRVIRYCRTCQTLNQKRLRRKKGKGGISI
jgi:hypothetical protein